MYDSRAKKEAILAAAFTCFANDGYESVGVRKIAAQAAVDPALIFRYYGSKAGLLQACLDRMRRMIGATEMIAEGTSDLGQRLATAILRPRDDREAELILLALRAAQSARTAPALLANVPTTTEEFAQALGGDQPYLRARIILSVIFGAATYHYLFVPDAVMRGETLDAYTREIADIIQRYANGMPRA